MYTDYYGVAKDHMMLFTRYLKNEFVSDSSTVYKEGQSVRGKVCHIYFVTGFVKTDPNCTRTEIHFIAEHLAILLLDIKPLLLHYPETPNTWL